MKAYNDKFTILLGIVTFVTIILQVSILIAGFFNPVFYPGFPVNIYFKISSRFSDYYEYFGEIWEKKINEMVSACSD